jgi:CDP-diglyceride synthetase
LSSLSGKIVVIQLSPPEPQKSNIDAIAGCIGGVLVAIVVGVIFLIFIRQDSNSTILSTIASDK